MSLKSVKRWFSQNELMQIKWKEKDWETDSSDGKAVDSSRLKGHGLKLKQEKVKIGGAVRYSGLHHCLPLEMSAVQILLRASLFVFALCLYNCLFVLKSNK